MELFSTCRRSLRAFVREPGFTTVAVLTVALGIGTATAVYSLVFAVLLRPYPYHAPEGLVRFESRHIKHGGALQGSSLLDVEDYRRRATTLEDIGAYFAFETQLLGDGPSEVATITQLNPAALNILGVRPVLGRLLEPEEDVAGGSVHNALISYSLWQSRFGADPNVLGRSLRTDRVAYTIVGVMPPGFGFPQQTSIWTPMESWFALLTPERAVKRRNARPYATIARLKPSVTLAQAEADLNAVAEALERDYPQENEGVRVKLTPLREFEAGPLRPYLLLLLAGVGLVLLTCCANVAALQVVRAARQRHDLAIRAALGAGRARMVVERLIESMVLALVGGALGLLLAHAAVRAMLALIPVTLPFWMVVRIDAAVLAFSLLVTIGTGLVFGLVPAMHASRGHVGELRDGGRHAPRRSRIQSALVVGEVALSLLLLVCAALLMQTLMRLQGIDAGFERDRLVTVRVVRFGGGGAVRQTAAAMSAMHDRVLDALHAVPGVTTAAVTNSVPFTGTQPERRQDTLSVRDRPETKVLVPLAGADVSPGYFRAMGIRLLRGRLFDRSDTNDSQLVVIINERGARMLWPDRDPIGQEVIWGAPSPSNTYCRVVGVVADIRHQSAERENGIELYYPVTQWPVAGGYYVVRVNGDADATAATIRSTIETSEPTLAVAEVKTMERRVDESLWQRRLWGVLFSGFAVLALALAAVGLYGVMSHTVARRTREIGIRMALGDRPLRVGRTVVRDGMSLVGAGLVVGAVAAFGAGRLIEGLLFGVPPHDAITFIIVTAVLVAAAFAAIVIPAYRAARVDPIVALRSD